MAGYATYIANRLPHEGSYWLEYKHPHITTSSKAIYIYMMGYIIIKHNAVNASVQQRKQ